MRREFFQTTKTALQLALVIGYTSSFFDPAPAYPAQDWPTKIHRSITNIDSQTTGNMGVYIKRLRDDSEMHYHADRNWYLSSTVKVPIAIAFLQKKNEGAVSLDEQITLQKSHYVDGSGEVLWKEPGTKLSYGYLLEKMLTQSDSTAADLIIHNIGLSDLNRRIHTGMGVHGFTPLTTILQVRYDAYSELHPKAKNLTNMDFIELKKLDTSDEKLDFFLSRLGVKRDELRAKSVEEAFEKYYEREFNSSTLVAYGQLIEKLVEGDLLPPDDTNMILDFMQKMTTGERRIKAGLPQNLRFAQKTGTQVRRMCNMGVVRKRNNSNPVIVAACVEKFEDPTEAENALKRVGELFPIDE